jgi:hypothetical protein
MTDPTTTPDWRTRWLLRLEPLIGGSFLNLIPWALMALFLVLFVHQCSVHPPQTEADKLSPATVARLNRLAADSARYRHDRDSLNALARASSHEATGHEQRADATLGTARTLQRQSDSLAALAREATTARDSAHFFEAALAKERARGDSIAAADAERQRAVVNLRASVSADSLRADRAEHRLGDTEQVVRDLRRDIAKLEVPCHVPGTFGRISCPSRRVSAVIGTIVGVVAGAASRS